MLRIAVPFSVLLLKSLIICSIIFWGENMHSTKVKTLLVYRLLEKYSDEEHPLTAPDLVDMLDEMGIKCERKSIYTDIEALKEMGCNIVSAQLPYKGVFIADRLFEIPEVMLLIDAVASAGFITTKKTNKLIEKLKTLVSVSQAQTLVSQVYVESSVAKGNNEEIYITIDKLHAAITNKKKVKFVYKRRSIDIQNKKKHTEKTFVVSPYALIWKDDHYYLVCNNEKYDNLMNLRIDRIKKLVELDRPARPVNEVSNYDDTFDARDYSAGMFSMFSGEKCTVRLACSLKLQEEMLDRFGPSIPLKAYDGSHFETTVNATLSDGFVSWLMQYGSDVEVLEPTELRTLIAQKAEAIYNVYNK